MNRRNFLAFIPAISAIPLIGKDIQKTESGLLIVQPEHLNKQVIASMKLENWQNIDCRLYQNGEHVASALLTQFTIHNEVIEHYDEIDGNMLRYPGAQTCEFTAIINSPIKWK